MRVENVDLELVAFAPEYKHIRVHRLCRPLPVWHAQRPMLPRNIAQPSRELLAFHLFAENRVFPVICLPSEFSGVINKKMPVPPGRFLAHLDQVGSVNRLGLRLRALPAYAGILLAAAGWHRVDLVAVLLEQL